MKNIGDRVFYLGILLMVILLPIQKMSTTIPFVIILIGFIFGHKSLAQRKFSFAIPVIIGLYYAVHVLSSFFSTYVGYAKNDLLIKAPLALLPLFFVLKSRLPESMYIKIWSIFLSSVSLVSSFILLRLLYFLTIEGQILSNVELVNYTIIHPSYLSAYILFALAVLWLAKHAFSSWQVKIILSLIFFVAIIFLASRLMIILSLVFLFYLLVQYLGFKAGIGLSFLIVVITSTTIALVPQLKERFVKAGNMLTHEAQEVNTYAVDDRLMTWKNTVDLIKDRPLVGYTNGDYCYHYLKEKHNQSGFGKGYRERLNAHNQLLESQLALGISGSILFLALFVLSLFFAIHLKEPIFIVFLLLTFSFAMVESIFQSQGGVMFFGFFLGLFLNKFKHLKG